MGKKNQYEGKGVFLIDGKTPEELGPKVFARVIAESFIKSMFEMYNRGELGPEYDCLKNWEYVPQEARTTAVK